MELVAGANRALPGGPVTVDVPGPYDLSALILSDDGKVASDADFVFYNQPAAPGVRWRAAAVTVDPTALRRGAARVVVLASPEDLRTPFARLPTPALTVTSRHSVIARFRPAGLTSETVVQLAEVYRHQGAWKLRAIGQGYADGLAGLARDFGVQVDDDGVAPAPPADEASGSSAIAVAVIAGTYRERAQHGLAPLTPEPLLAAAAQAHGEDMVNRRYFSHDSTDGRSVADRVLAAGYTYRVVAENIAAGQRTAEEVVDGWMNSPGHRANVLSPDVRQIGIGFVSGGEFGKWVQVFGTPR